MSLLLLDALIEGFDMVEAGFEKTGIGGVAIGGDAFEEDGVALVEAVLHKG